MERRSGRYPPRHKPSPSVVLNVQVADELRVLLDEVEAELGLAAHQALDQLRRLLVVAAVLLVRKRHAQEGAARRVHSGVAQLFRGHLAEALEAAHLDLAFGGLEHGLEYLVLVRIVAGIKRLAALRQAIEGRQREEKPARLDQLRHLAEKEGHQQRGDVRAVDIGVGHDDDALVAELRLVVALAAAAAERQHEVRELLVLTEAIGRRAGDVQDLAAERQDRLRLAVARLFRRAAGAVALHQEDLGAARVAAAAIRELAGKPQLAGRALALEFFLLAFALAIFRALDDEIEQLPRAV